MAAWLGSNIIQIDRLIYNILVALIKKEPIKILLSKKVTKHSRILGEIVYSFQ